MHIQNLQLTIVFTKESDMTKKILIILIIMMVLLASTTPVVAQKPTEPNGNANKTHENQGKGNEPSKKETPQNPAAPGLEFINTSSSSNGNIITGNQDNTHGFDEYGYNRTARIFNGTGLSWCQAKGMTEAQCEGTLGDTVHDRLVMKWNAEWDRGNDEGWSNPPYNAWENNQWNGKVSNGSGDVWHYKIVWVGSCGVDGTLLENGGYCIWGQFAVIMDQGTSGTGHEWSAHAIPNGYGSYP
jgi:hypothetical protein